MFKYIYIWIYKKKELCKRRKYEIKINDTTWRICQWSRNQVRMVQWNIPFAPNILSNFYSWLKVQYLDRLNKIQTKWTDSNDQEGRGIFWKDMDLYCTVYECVKENDLQTPIAFTHLLCSNWARKPNWWI